MTLSDLERRDATSHIFFRRIFVPLELHRTNWTRQLVGGACSLGPATLSSQKGGPQSSQFWCSPLFMIIPFDAERPNLTVVSHVTACCANASRGLSTVAEFVVECSIITRKENYRNELQPISGVKIKHGQRFWPCPFGT